MNKKNAFNIFTSSTGTRAALWLGRSLPSWIGLPIANLFADFISSQRNLKHVQAVRNNQRIIHQGKLTEKELDLMVRAAFRHAAYNIYEYYHTLNDPHAVERVILPPPVQSIFARILSEKCGWLFVAPHISNYDLMGRVVAAHGLSPVVLSIARPPGGYQLQNNLRLASGLEMAPASIDSLHLATERLRNGGMVITAAERPFPESKYKPRFFGHPALLPTVHIKLALNFHLPVYILGGFRRPDKRLEIYVSDPIEMLTQTGNEDRVLVNAEIVLQKIEEYIRLYPTQWNMSFPVWPDITI